MSAVLPFFYIELSPFTFFKLFYIPFLLTKIFITKFLDNLKNPLEKLRSKEKVFSLNRYMV